MRTPFKDSRAALIASGYDCVVGAMEHRVSASAPIVFGGEVVCLECFEGASYSNRGRVHVKAELSLMPRYSGRHEFVLATQMAKKECGDEIAALAKYPRSDAQAREALRLAVIVDAAAARLLPKAKQDVQQAARDAEQARAAFDRKREVSAIATGELADEVLRLFRGGFLDESNSLAALREIAAKMAV